MVAGAILKCIMLAQFHVEVVETPISEYAMATMNKVHNGVEFESTVIEGRLNSITIEIPGKGRTMTFSTDYNQRTLGARLELANEPAATIDCEVI